MSVRNRLQGLRQWFPVPTAGTGGVKPIRWLLLEGGRHAVTGALLTFVFVAILGIGIVWTFEMQRLLTETTAVQSLLDTFLSGIILLVSIVVSISAIVLSYDIASVGSQRERIQEANELRRQVGHFSEAEKSPRSPGAFLRIMADVVLQHAKEVESAADEMDGEFTDDIQEYVSTLSESVGNMDSTLEQASGGEFDVLWKGLEMDYGMYLDRSNKLRTSYSNEFTDEIESKFDELTMAFELFETGKEYFKTLYYSREIARLSRTLLFISLPAIVITATTKLAIDASLLPDLWVLGLPPLLTFVALSFTIALAPFVVLTAFMLRVMTVAFRTPSAGPFVLDS